ncbi:MULTISPECIES: hypothetical protein [unclassified Streptomyces]|uniref:hypothetical protein n=1 Tax=unclassified Streptomyces TaxID=2593676 RepID=UPI0036E777A8
MPKFLPQRGPARLRRLAGDRRLHVTDGGVTTSGYLAGIGIAYTSGDVPYVCVELDESEHDLFTDGTDAARLEIRADRLLAVDAQDLAVSTLDSWAWQELQRLLASLKEFLIDGEAPPCQHEDVIETPGVGSTTEPGVCVWCPQPLVKLNDEWIPA